MSRVYKHPEHPSNLIATPWKPPTTVSLWQALPKQAPLIFYLKKNLKTFYKMQEKQYSFTDVKQSEEMDTSGPESERVKCFKLATDKFKHIRQCAIWEEIAYLLTIT